MARKKKETQVSKQTNEFPMAVPAETADGQNGQPLASADQPPPEVRQSEPPAEPAADGGNRPVRVLSYLIGHETYAQVQVWERHVQRRDGGSFLTYDISLRKRYRDGRDGQWKTLYSFAASELYAVHHALDQAACFVAECRAADTPF